ncbi:MAG: PaaI family thioesterase [bacterium]|nr:PaaI family thioesterase [bacterium]
MDREFAVKLEKSLYDALPLVKALDIRVEEGRPGYVKVSMVRSPVVVNHFGAFHAGALYTFAETVGGAVITATFNLEKNTLINKRGEIKYRKTVTQKAVSEASFALEDMERIMAEVEEKGKTEFEYPVIVKNEDGEVACEVTFDFYVRKNRD